MSTVSQVMEIVETLAPSYLKFEGDKIGLQVGDPDASIKKTLVALEVTPEVFEEAKAIDAQLILSHHPVIFTGLTRVRLDEYIGGLIASLLSSGISVLAAHTNLDRAKNGVNDALAHALDLQNIEVLVPATDVDMVKLTVFVPEGYIDRVVTAIGSTGGGIIGDYSFCTFRTKGTGTFYPSGEAQPYSGLRGELNQVEEFRVEAVVPAAKLNRVVNAMLNAHPYEEVAYDVFHTRTAPSGVGFGRIGMLSTPRNLRDCAEAWSERLNAELRVSGDWDMEVKRVAVCGGSGSELMRTAKAAGADVFVTGDIKHHAAHNAREIGLAVIDAGHAETERLVLPNLTRELTRVISEKNLDIEVVMSRINTSPWNKR